MKQYVPSVSNVYSAIFRSQKTAHVLYVVFHPKGTNIVATVAITLLIRRKYKHSDRIDAIERIGRFIHMSYGMTRALLQRRAARDGIPLDMVIAIVQQERSI